MDGKQVDGDGWIFAFVHDVRTNLRTILTRIQLVQSSGLSVLAETDQAMLQEAVDASRDIDSLLSAVVAYCEENAEEGFENLRRQLQGLLIDRKAALREAGAELEVATDLDTLVPAGLKSVLKELVTNACRFRSSERPLRILIESRMVESGLELTVSDNGIGVDPAYLEKIFTPFFRLHAREKFPGHGLGLATCCRRVACWGGTIAAERKPEPGLRVRIVLPVMD